MTEQEFFKEVGKRIREFRKQKGLTQKEVAEKAQINRGDLATFENKGERIKSADIIRRIVEATGHNMPDLFQDVADEKKKSLRLSFAVNS
jgi:transcriptional regulator with XRE-family HTH domain